MTPADTEMSVKLSISIHINVTADPANAAAVIVLDGLFMMSILVYRKVFPVASPEVGPVVLRQGNREVCWCFRSGWIYSKIYRVTCVRFLPIYRYCRSVTVIGTCREGRGYPRVRPACVRYIAEQHRIAEDVIAGDLCISQRSSICVLGWWYPVKRLWFNCEHQW